MTNITDNKLNLTMPEVDIVKINDALVTLNEAMPFLIGLTKIQRQTLPKINRQNKLFVDEAIQSMKNNRHLVPNYINFEELEKDFILYKQLNDINLSLRQLSEKVNDTQMLAGSEAYSMALMFYRMSQIAAQAGIPGADTVYDTLKARFAGQGSSNETTNESDVDASNESEV